MADPRLPAVELHLRVDGRGDRTRQVYPQVRAAIADGLLRPGEAVRSSQELAQRLGVACNTGESLHPLLAALCTWSMQHMPDVAQARAVAGGV
jgi:hypothetical protein